MGSFCILERQLSPRVSYDRDLPCEGGWRTVTLLLKRRVEPGYGITSAICYVEDGEAARQRVTCVLTIHIQTRLRRTLEGITSGSIVAANGQSASLRPSEIQTPRNGAGMWAHKDGYVLAVSVGLDQCLPIRVRKSVTMRIARTHLITRAACVREKRCRGYRWVGRLSTCGETDESCDERSKLDSHVFVPGLRVIVLLRALSLWLAGPGCLTNRA